MASFVENLWNSVFTPGPTPTLLVATNASFGALQLLLLILLIATRSLHFVVLSFLCGGLWYSINWFAREIQAERAKVEADKKNGGEHKQGGTSRLKKEKSPEPGSDTETEAPPQTTTTIKRKPAQANTASGSSSSTATSTGAAMAAHPELAAILDPGSRTKPDHGSRDRHSIGDSSGYVSTDSEWEKVSEGDGKGL